MGSALNQPSGLPGAQLTQVGDVSLSDGHLTWAGAEESQKAKVEEIVFILKSPGLDTSFIICTLKEDPENAETPFQFSLLSTPAISDDQLHKYIIHELPPHLRNDEGNQVDVIVSTKSGLGKAQALEATVLGPLWEFARATLEGSSEGNSTGQQGKAKKSNYNLTITESADTIREFARDLHSLQAENRSRTVVLLSGDGGVVDLLNGSDETPSPANLPVIALLPLGTGNALFHSTHKPLYSDPSPTPLILALRTLFLGQPADLPVFRASFSPGSRIVTFTEESKPSNADGDLHLKKQETRVSHLSGAIVASYGFHASIVYESDTPEYRIHGDKRFGMVAQELLRESHPYTAKVEIRRPGSSTFEAIPRETHAYVLTTLVSNLERKFTISPASKPLEGRLRLVHFGPVDGKRAMELMMLAYDGGKHVGDGEVGYEEVEEVRVTTLEENERWRKVCIDGTIVEIPKGGWMSVKVLERKAFRILVDPSVLQD